MVSDSETFSIKTNLSAFNIFHKEMEDKAL